MGHSRLRFLPRYHHLAATLLFMFPTVTSAGGFDLPTLAAGQQGTSNANAAEANDATVIFYNPAGMTRLHGINVSNSVSLLAIQGKVQDLGTTGTPPPGATNQQDGARITNAGPAGSFWPSVLGAASLAATAEINDRISVGLGVFAPGGGKLDYKYNWSGASFIKSLDLEIININPSMAIRFDRQHSIGFGISALAAHSSDKVPFNVQGIAPYLLQPLVLGLNPNPVGIVGSLADRNAAFLNLQNQLKGLGLTIPAGALVGNLTPVQQGQLSSLLGQVLLAPDASGGGRIGMIGFGFGYNLGYMFQYDDKTRLSIAYRSSSKIRMHGDLKWDDSNLNTTSVAGIRIPLPDVNTGELLTAEQYVRRYLHPDTDTSSTLELPARLSISGFRQLTDKIDVMLDYTFIQTSVNKDISVTLAPAMGGPNGTTPIYQGPGLAHLNWRDSFKASAGMNYHVDDKLVLRTGFQYDMTPVPDAQDRSPAAPDSDRFMYSVGAGYKIDKTTSVDVAYSYIVLADALSDYRDPCRGIYLEQGNSLSTNPASCTGNGGTFRGRFYDTTIQILSAQVNKKF